MEALALVPNLQELSLELCGYASQATLDVLAMSLGSMSSSLARLEFGARYLPDPWDVPYQQLRVALPALETLVDWITSFPYFFTFPYLFTQDVGIRGMISTRIYAPKLREFSASSFTCNLAQCLTR